MTPPAQAEIEYEERESKVRRRRIASLAPQDERGSAERRAEELEERLETLEREQERLQLALSPHAGAHPRVHAARRASGTGTVPRKPRIEGMAAPRRVDVEARKELATMHVDRRDFLRKSAIGAGVLALGVGLGYGSGYAQAAGLTGGTRTVITDTEIAARVIGGVRIATEFIPDPVPAGTDADPYPGSAIQAALNDGLAVYIPSGTWSLSSTISRPIDGVNIIGAGKSTKLALDGVTPCISAGSQNGWLIANLATDAGAVHIGAATESRITEIWVDGALTDNRPRAASGGGSGGGYYGVRAEDYITSGTGTDANPYNASAIESAINALPNFGGVVFIKEGIYRGSRIFLGGTGQAGRAKSIILQGVSADLSGLNWANYQAVGGDDLFGTVLDGGFEVNTYGCQVQFKNLLLMTPSGANLKFVGNLADEAITSNNALPTGGFRIQDCKFLGGDPAIHITGLNTGGTGHQNWNVLIERIHIREAARAIRIDDDGGTEYNSIFRGNIRHVIIQAVGDVGTDPAVFVDIANLKGHWYDWLIEDSGPTGAGAYCLYVRTARTEGFTFSDIDFGDNIRSPLGAYFENYLSGQMTIRNLIARKNVEVAGCVDIEVGRAAQFGDTGTVNVNSANHVEIRKIKGLDLVMGTINNPNNVLIHRGPGAVGHIGSSTAGASPFTYTNNDAYIEEVHLVGGTITDVSRNGQSLGTNRVITLAPGQSIVITWNTTVPTIRRFGIS